MEKKVRLYGGFMVVAAFAVTWALAYSLPALPYPDAVAPAVFALMGFIAQSIARSARKTFTGSIAFLPFLTSIVLYPSWICVVLVGLAMLIGEVRAKKANIKRAFNVAQYMVAVGGAAAVYVFLGGKPIDSTDTTFR